MWPLLRNISVEGQVDEGARQACRNSPIVYPFVCMTFSVCGKELTQLWRTKMAWPSYLTDDSDFSIRCFTTQVGKSAWKF